MSRPSLPARRVVGVALALTVGTGIGLGAYSIGSASGTDGPPAYRTGTTNAAASSGGSASSGGPASSAPAGTSDAPAAPGATTAPQASPADLLTLDEAVAIAVEFAPGRVVEVDEDHEPTGLQYDVTVLHDNNTATTVDVDATTGQIVGHSFDDDWS